MPIVKHLNNFVFFIKKRNSRGATHSAQSGAGEFDLAVSFTLLTNINQVALSISEQLCR